MFSSVLCTAWLITPHYESKYTDDVGKKKKDMYQVFQHMFQDSKPSLSIDGWNSPGSNRTPPRSYSSMYEHVVSMQMSLS